GERADPGTARQAGAAPPPAGVSAASFDPSVPIRAKWALIVGVGTFTDKSVKPLDLAPKAARDLTRAITNPAIGRFAAANVRTLVDSQATLVNIRREIGWLRSQA